MSFDAGHVFGEIAARLLDAQEALERVAGVLENTPAAGGGPGAGDGIERLAREMAARDDEARRALGENTRALKDNTAAIRRTREELVKAFAAVGGVVITE